MYFVGPVSQYVSIFNFGVSVIVANICGVRLQTVLVLLLLVPLGEAAARLRPQIRLLPQGTARYRTHRYSDPVLVSSYLICFLKWAHFLSYYIERDEVVSLSFYMDNIEPPLRLKIIQILKRHLI